MDAGSGVDNGERSAYELDLLEQQQKDRGEIKRLRARLAECSDTIRGMAQERDAAVLRQSGLERELRATRRLFKRPWLKPWLKHRTTEARGRIADLERVVGQMVGADARKNTEMGILRGLVRDYERALTERTVARARERVKHFRSV
jgi:DNA repair exonuclease SbcCD ATPase subunit